MKFIENCEGEFLNIDYIVKIFTSFTKLNDKPVDTTVYEIICEMSNHKVDVLSIHFSEEEMNRELLEIL